MSIEEYSPSEIEIQSLGIRITNQDYLDLTEREYLVIGSTVTTTITSEDDYSNKNNVTYSMIVNDSGIGINTTRNNFDDKFLNGNRKGIYIASGDIHCDGVITAKSIQFINDDGLPINFDPEAITADSLLVEISNMLDSSTPKFYEAQHDISNIYATKFVNINSAESNAQGNLHPLNIIRSALKETNAMHISLKNLQSAQEYTYLEEQPGGEPQEIPLSDPASLNIGIIGKSYRSPAIISTTKNMPLEFHVSKNYKDIDNLYKSGDTPNYESQDEDLTNYPALTITENGKVAIGKNYVDVLPPGSDSEKPNLQVHGSSLFDKIYLKSDGEIKLLDDIYIKTIGAYIEADKVKPGLFSGSFEFSSNLKINNDLETDNLIVNSNITFVQGLNINTLKIEKLDIENTQETSIINAPIQFKNNIQIESTLNLPSDSLQINGTPVHALGLSNIKFITVNGDTLTTQQGDEFFQGDYHDKIALYYGLNSDSGLIVDNSNISIFGNLGVGIELDDSLMDMNSKIAIKNNDVDRGTYEIGLYDSTNTPLSYIGHYKTQFGDNDKSLIIKTENTQTPDKTCNIYFYVGKTNDDIASSSANIIPTMAILENESIGINTIATDTDLTDLNIKLHINGNLLVDDIYIKGSNGIKKNTLQFVKNINSNGYFLKDGIHKYFVNYESQDISTGKYNNSKTFNLKGSINVEKETINDGYYEDGIKIETPKIIRPIPNKDLDIYTSYIQTNLLIGLENSHSQQLYKEKFINTDEISKPPLMIRNVSKKKYNDTIIRLYRGNKNDEIGATAYQKSKYSGIDFCEWNTAVDNNKEKWYIYRNYEANFNSGILEIGYMTGAEQGADNIHPSQSGLEIIKNDSNYYFIYNRKDESLPTQSDLSSGHPTTKIYGNIEIVGNINFTGDITKDGELITLGTDSSSGSGSGPTLKSVTTDPIQSLDTDVGTDDVLMLGDKIIFRTTEKQINTTTTIGDEFFDNLIQYYDTNILSYYNNNNSLTTFVKEYSNGYNNPIFDFSSIFVSTDNTISTVNNIKLSLEDPIIVGITQETIDDSLVYPSALSIKNKTDNNLISFYNDNKGTYINIGNNNIKENDYYEKISLHIQDNTDYLLQLSTKNSSKPPIINFHNDFSFWLLEGPDIEKKFNIKYGQNVYGFTPEPDSIINIMTITKEKNIGINNYNPDYTLDVLSENNISCRLKNDYSNDLRNNFDNPHDFTLIQVENCNLTFSSNLDVNISETNISNIIFNLDIGINSEDIPNYTIDQEYIYNDLKNNQNFIKTKNFENITNISIPILFENSIPGHAINFSDFDDNTFFVINKASYNDTTIELSTEIELLSFKNLNYSNYEFKVNNSLIETSELTSNINMDNILISNKYNKINNQHQFSCNINNYYMELDDTTSNIHIEYYNYLNMILIHHLQYLI